MPIDKDGKYQNPFDYYERLRTQESRKPQSETRLPPLTPDPDVSPFIKAANSSTNEN